MQRLMAAAQTPFRVRAKEDMKLGQVSDDLVIRTINEALEKLSCEQLVHSEWILTTKDRGPSGKVVSGIHVRLLLIRGLLAADSTFSISPGTG
ncbi:hypothetical protein Tco_0188192 [Tanacetum coccineum]